MPSRARHARTQSGSSKVISKVCVEYVLAICIKEITLTTFGAVLTLVEDLKIWNQGNLLTAMKIHLNSSHFIGNFSSVFMRIFIF